jgi:general secretion pathway protein G
MADIKKYLGNMKNKGFTLLELIVAMAILAIITTALWGNFFSALYKGRDSRRKQDLESVTRALELYYHDNKAYPTALPSLGTPFVHPTNGAVIYMEKLPLDPASSGLYCYNSDGKSYKLFANLENTEDPKVLLTPAQCDSHDFNYVITSSNVAP